MTLPQMFGTRQRVTPQKAVPGGSGIPEIRISKKNAGAVTVTVVDEAKMNDGDDNTYGTIQMNGSYGTADFDLGTWFALSGCVFIWSGNQASGGTPTIRLQWSADNITYTDIMTSTGFSNDIKAGINYTTSIKWVRWVRIRMEAVGSGDWTAKIYEIIPMV